MERGLRVNAGQGLNLPRQVPVPPEDRQRIETTLQKRLGRKLTAEEKRFLMLSFVALDEEEHPTRAVGLRQRGQAKTCPLSAGRIL